MQSPVVFWIGTEAELIKVVPIMKLMAERELPFEIAATGQNPIHQSELLNLLPHQPPILQISKGPGRKSSFGLLLWFLATTLRSLRLLGTGRRRLLLIHGDTVSTLMGAFVGWLKGYRIGHVEAGLRSHNYFQPFPEEICRVLSSRFVTFSFCPNEEAAGNLGGTNERILSTRYNTLIDSLQLFLSEKSNEFAGFKQKYFVFVIHRQENLFNKEFVRTIAKKILKYSSEGMGCVFILHEPTRATLRDVHLLDSFEKNPNVMCLPRQPYFNFMAILSKAEFLVTDGGSNQEESFYMGLPCLILRNFTERKEGLGHNAILAGQNESIVSNFLKDPARFRRKRIIPETSPSTLIVNFLVKTNETQ